MAKLDDRSFCYFTAAMFVSLRGAETWRLHTKLYKFKWNTSPNNGRMKTCTDLSLGEVYIPIIFHIPASWLNLLNGYDFYFWYFIFIVLFLWHFKPAIAELLRAESSGAELHTLEKFDNPSIAKIWVVIWMPVLPSVRLYPSPKPWKIG